MRVSTAVLLVAFIALFWVYHNVEPTPAPEPPAPAVVPPGFVPDPNYTWVPRTNVRRPKENVETTTTTTTPTTTTSSPTDTDDDQPYVADDESHVADRNHPADDRGGSGRFGPAGADYPAFGADVARSDTDHHVSAQLGRKTSPATLALRDDLP